MMEYKGSYFSLITLVIKKPMIRQYGREQTKKWLKGAKPVYKQMLAELGLSRGNQLRLYHTLIAQSERFMPAGPLQTLINRKKHS